jgi:hypothetical protein
MTATDLGLWPSFLTIFPTNRLGRFATCHTSRDRSA